MIEAPGVHKTCCFYVDIPGFLAVSLKHFIPRKAGIHGWNPAHACARAHSKTLKKTRVGKQHIYSWLTWVSFEFTALGAPTKNTSFCWESILTHPLERFFLLKAHQTTWDPTFKINLIISAKFGLSSNFRCLIYFAFGTPVLEIIIFFWGWRDSIFQSWRCFLPYSGILVWCLIWQWMVREMWRWWVCENGWKKGVVAPCFVCVCVRVCGVQCRASFSISGKQVGMAVTCHGPPWQSGVLQKWDQRILHNDVSQKRLFGHCILSMHVSIICWCNIILWIWFWCT